MHARLVSVSLIFAVGLALSACSSDSQGASTTAVERPAEEPAAEKSAVTTAPDGLEIDAANPAEDATSDGGCDLLLSKSEIDSILGTSVKIEGSGKICQLVFADDAVGSLQIFAGSQAEEAMATLLPAFLSDPVATAAGFELPDGRGFVDGPTVVVLGDSARVFRVDLPDNMVTADVEAAMPQLAELLLPR